MSSRTKCIIFGHQWVQTKEGFFIPNDGSGQLQRCTQYTCSRCGSKEVRGYANCDAEEARRETILPIDMDKVPGA